MNSTIEIKTLRIKFSDVLDLTDDAIKNHKILLLPYRAKNSNSNTLKFLRWAEKHHIIEISYIKSPQSKISKPKSIRSRKKKIEITLQLQALGVPISEIAKIFNVKQKTAKGYLKTLVKFDQNYLNILKIVLTLKGIDKSTKPLDFLSFPIRIENQTLQKNLHPNNYNQLINLVNKNRFLKFTTGKNLGTKALSILLPKNEKTK